MADAREDGVALLFIEGGEACAARLVSDGERRLRIVDSSGKHRRIDRFKSACRLSRLPTEEENAEARRLASKLEIDKVWHCAAGEALDAGELSRRCLPAAGTPVAELALVIAQGKEGGMFRIQDCVWQPVSAKQRSALLQGRKKRAAQKMREKQWLDDLAEGFMPDELKEYLDAYIRGIADCNDRRHRFLQQYGRVDGRSIGQLAYEHEVITDMAQYHLRELDNRLPKSRMDEPVALPDGLALVAKEACSIDAVGTVEIDDAFSADDGEFGIHIAAPGLGLPQSALKQAEERKFTIYLPDSKHMMLPPFSVEAYSLQAGGPRPSVSLVYERSGEVINFDSPSFKIGMIDMKANLDIEDFGAEDLQRPKLEQDLQDSLLRIHEAAKSVESSGMQESTGHLVKVEQGRPVVLCRSNFAAADRCVAALMVHYNTIAAKKLDEQGVPYLRRSSGRITIKREGESYGWFTSPLRRLVDLFNQQQLIATIQGEKAPHSAKQLAAIAKKFNTSYSWGMQLQQRLDTLWSLRWLAEKKSRKFSGVVAQSEDRVRLDDAPVSVRINTTATAGEKVRVRIDLLDEYSLIASGALV